MARLKSRQLSIPGGFRFILPETGFQSRPFASFDSIVTALMAHVSANPALAAKHKWPTDRQGIEMWVEHFNAAMCVQMGWNDYVLSAVGEPPPPKSKPPSQDQQSLVAAAGVKSKKIWAGVKTLNDWFDSQEPAVPSELSTARAKACSECPFNEPGDYTKWFTQPAAEAVRRQVEKFSERKLSTPYDDKLQTCKACLCVNKLAVHAPLRLKLAHMSADTYAELKTAPDCWVVKEKEAGLT